MNLLSLFKICLENKLLYMNYINELTIKAFAIDNLLRVVFREMVLLYR